MFGGGSLFFLIRIVEVRFLDKINFTLWMFFGAIRETSFCRGFMGEFGLKPSRVLEYNLLSLVFGF